MKIVKWTARLIGLIAIIASVESCKKEDPNECCTFSYSYGSYSISGKACQDGTFTYTYNGTSDTGTWTDDYDSWSEVKSLLVNDYGATCS